MAYVEAKPRASGFVVKIKSKALGLDTSFQTGTKTKRVAKAQCDSVNANISRVERGELVFADGWDARQKLFLLRTGQMPEVQKQAAVRLRDAIKRYVEAKRSLNKAHNTVVSYGIHLKNAADHFGDIKLENITRRMIQEWGTKQAKTVITSGKHIGELTSHASVQKRLAALKRLLKWLKSYHEIPDDYSEAFEGIELPIQESKWDILDWQTLAERRETLEKQGLPDDRREAFEKVYFNHDELARLIAVAEEKLFLDGTPASRRLFVALCFAAYTSARRSELVRVTRKDVNLEDGTVRLRLKKGRGQKAYKFHIFPLHDDLKELLAIHLEELPTNQLSLFASNDAHIVGDKFEEKEERSKAEALGDALKEALAETEFRLCSGWHIHRHSFISMLAENKVGIEQAKSLVGHSTSAIHLRYRHDSFSGRRETVDLVGSLREKGTQGVQNPDSRIAELQEMT
jgi:integrase